MTNTDTVNRLNTVLNGNPFAPWNKGILARLRDPTMNSQLRAYLLEQLKPILEEMKKLLPLQLGVSFLWGRNTNILMHRLGTATSIAWRDRQRTNGKEPTIELEITMEGIGPPAMKGPIERFQAIRIPQNSIGT